MTLDQLIEEPELDPNHHLRTMLSIPLNDRISFEKHQSEITYANMYEFAKTVLDEVHAELGVIPPDAEESWEASEPLVWVEGLGVTET